MRRRTVLKVLPAFPLPATGLSATSVAANERMVVREMQCTSTTSRMARKGRHMPGIIQRVFPVLICMMTAGSCVAQQGNYSNASIENLNLKFRALYAAAREERIAGTRPVVIVRGDNLVLLKGERRIEGETVHANYHDLKTIAHVPLAIFCVLGSRCDVKLAPEFAEKLQDLRLPIAEVRQQLKESFVDPEVRNRQERMLQQCAAFIDGVLAAQTCSARELDTFIDSIRPSILLNAEGATKLTIDSYHKQMLAWRSELSADEWASTYVVIPGASLARKNFVAVQYFAKLFGERGEGKRIIFAESQFEESQELQLLGSHILDTEVGVAFFDDPWRMQRDLLSSAADSYLDTMDFD